MSLINQMLKDLEERRSSDLETSESLNSNIAWESNQKRKGFGWLTLIAVVSLVLLLVVVGYLLLERSSVTKSELLEVKQQVIAAEKKANKLAAIQQAEKKARAEEKIREQEKEKREVKRRAEEQRNAIKRAEENARIEAKIRAEEKVRAEVKIREQQAAILNAQAVEKLKMKNNATSLTNPENTKEIDDSPQIDLKKKHRPLNNLQLAEIAYNKGYKLLQQGRMHKGREHLREALSLYLPHIRAREMLAGIYIKSGQLINAAEILSEGVKVVPEYSLFAQLYARVLLEQNKPQLAIRVLERGVAVTAVEPDYHALLAATYQRVNNHQKSVDIYLRLVKVRPNEGVWWLGLAISLEKTGKNKQALEAYQRAQKTGSLKAGLVKFTNNRVSALQEIGFPETE